MHTPSNSKASSKVCISGLLHTPSNWGVMAYCSGCGNLKGECQCDERSRSPKGGKGEDATENLLARCADKCAER
eukprot:5462051-Karenia_brevis.AAC.1